MKKLTNKQAYEIIRDNTNWAWVLPQDVKFKYGWIFHRTRDCFDGEYHKCKNAIDCYATDSLYSYEHTGCQLENFECCNFEDSPFKAKNEDKVFKTLKKLAKIAKFNSSFNDGNLIEHKNINVGMAIALPVGLIVPAVLSCEDKSLT